MVFSIGFVGDSGLADAGELLPGRIVAGDLNERFMSAIGYWSAEDYRRQWIAAVDVIIGGGQKAALITSFERPSGSGALDWWPIFRERQTIYIQSQVLIFAHLSEKFDASRATEFVGTRREFSEGRRISEWSFGLADLVKFRNRPV